MQETQKEMQETQKEMQETQKYMNDLDSVELQTEIESFKFQAKSLMAN